MESVSLNGTGVRTRIPPYYINKLEEEKRCAIDIYAVRLDIDNMGSAQRSKKMCVSL